MVAKQWSDAMVMRGKQVDVLVKVDVGFHRCGIDPDAREAMPMIKAVASLPGLRLRGLLSHAGQAYHAHSEDELRTDGGGRGADDDATWRSVAARMASRSKRSARARRRRRGSRCGRMGSREFRPGNYVYFDRTQVALGAATIDDCALTVLATVVSKPAANRIILDSGSKTLSNDGARGFAPLAGHGTVLRLPGGSHAGQNTPGGEERDATSGKNFSSGDLAIDDDLVIERLSEEHATVRVLSGATDLEPGDRVQIIPNHSCVVSNLVDQAWLVDGAMVEPLPIAARGRIT